MNVSFSIDISRYYIFCANLH